MRLIDACKLQNEYKNRHDGKRLLLIDVAPAVDAVPVARGKWNHDGSNWENRFICDQCGYKWFFEAEEANFCPNCGTDMREENNG